MPDTAAYIVNIAVLTVSDTRDVSNDTSGDVLVAAALQAGHQLLERCIVKDDIYQLRAQVSQWIADAAIDAILITGGTGFSSRDSTPEAVQPLFDKTIEGFGELFRAVSFEEIGSSTMQSRAVAGIANRTVIFAVPGSTGACKTAWSIIGEQLDSRHKPCNFIGALKLSQ
jgi:molybdenum cofactor biosynthesis protein B